MKKCHMLLWLLTEQASTADSEYVIEVVTISIKRDNPHDVKIDS